MSTRGFARFAMGKFLIALLALSHAARAQPKVNKPVKLPNGVLFLDPVSDQNQVVHLGVWQNARKNGVYLLGMHGEWPGGGLLTRMSAERSWRFLDRLSASPAVRRSPLTFLAVCYSGSADEIYLEVGDEFVQTSAISAVERWHRGSRRPVLAPVKALRTVDFRVWDHPLATLDQNPPIVTFRDDQPSFVYVTKRGKQRLISRDRALKISMRAGWIQPLADPCDTAIVGSRGPRRGASGSPLSGLSGAAAEAGEFDVEAGFAAELSAEAAWLMAAAARTETAKDIMSVTSDVGSAAFPEAAEKLSGWSRAASQFCDAEILNGDSELRVPARVLYMVNKGQDEALDLMALAVDSNHRRAQEKIKGLVSPIVFDGIRPRWNPRARFWAPFRKETYSASNVAWTLGF